MSKAGKKMIEGLKEAITMKKLMDENEKLREELETLVEKHASIAEEHCYPNEGKMIAKRIRASVDEK